MAEKEIVFEVTQFCVCDGIVSLLASCYAFYVNYPKSVSAHLSLVVEHTYVPHKVGIKAGKIDQTLTAIKEDLSTCRLLFYAPESVLCITWRAKM